MPLEVKGNGTQLEQRAAQQRKRNLQVVVPLSSREIAVVGNRYLNFSSNDYLGLSQHPKVLELPRRGQ